MDVKTVNTQLAQAELAYQDALARFQSARSALYEMNAGIERMSGDANTKPTALAKALSEYAAAKILLPAHEASANSAHAEMMRLRQWLADAEREQKGKVVRLEGMKRELKNMQTELSEKQHFLTILQGAISRHSDAIAQLQGELARDTN